MDMLGYQILDLPVTSQRKNLMLVCKYIGLFSFTTKEEETLKILNFILFLSTRQNSAAHQYNL
jgi:hypothetical protein